MQKKKINVEYTHFETEDFDSKLIILFNRVSHSIKQHGNCDGEVQSSYIYQLAALFNRLGLNKDQIISWAVRRYFRDDLQADTIATIIYSVYRDSTSAFGTENEKLIQFL